MTDTYLLVDAGETASWWIYNQDVDSWFCFDPNDRDLDDVQEAVLDNGYQSFAVGIDGGAAAIIETFGLRDVSDGYAKVNDFSVGDRVRQVRDETLTEAQRELDLAVARAESAEKVAHEQAEALNRLNEQYDTTQANFTAVTDERDRLNQDVTDLQRDLASAKYEAEALRRTLVKAQSLFREAEAPRFADLLDGYLAALKDLRAEQ